MAQTTTAAYSELDADQSKAPDFLICLAGWPEVYTCHSTPTIPASGFDVCTDEGFDATRVRMWAERPNIAGEKMKGVRPEEGGFTIGEMEVDILDKYGVSTFTRDLTELVSRQALLEGNLSGTETTLTDSPLTKAATTINLASTAGLASGSV